MTDHPDRNRLSRETSPYLLQHAGNPVDWYPWGDEALQRARREDKPILLSIGYSACHWCHVMAHESFEDEDTATIMNELFVNIKVDREERPDLDKIYQLAHQLLARRPGGWPLTVFLNPHDHVPFFTGTYFPKESRYNLPAFGWLLRQVADYYREKKHELEQSQRALIGALGALQSRAMASESISAKNLAMLAHGELAANFDAIHGGFGEAPKFPHPTSLEFLLRHWATTRDADTLRMTVETLTRMAEGGIYDHLGGGFCRYAVDARWRIPHFEKMLYDNGPLLALYSQAWQATQIPLFRRVAEETAEWVIREMQSPEGGYYSSLDADSEGEEGKFYVWKRAAVKTLLTPDEYAVIELHYGLDETPNFEGSWHFFVSMPLDAIASRLGLSLDRVEERWRSGREKLRNMREKRIRPGRDEKILTSWNALMIKAMAIAGRILEREDFIASAERAYEFLHCSVRRNQRLLATYKDGRPRFPAYLDDYAFLIDASLAFLQCHWSSSALLWANELADDLIRRFEDQHDGGFFFTAADHETLIHRPKSTMDEALPAGNGIAAFALMRLGHLTGDVRYVDAAERTVKASTAAIQSYPSAHCSFLMAVDEWLNPPQIIVLRGEVSEMEIWRKTVQGPYEPRRLCFAIPSQNVTGLPGMLAERGLTEGVVAHVCEAARCLPVIGSLEALKKILTGEGQG